MRSHVAMAMCALALLATGAYIDRTLLAAGGEGKAAGCESSPTASGPDAESSAAAWSPLRAPQTNRTSFSGLGGDDPKSPALFLFLMGAEGTGHHLFMDMYRKSPSFRHLSSWGYVADGKYKRLLASLFNNRAVSKGLWSAPCAPMMAELGGGEAVVDGNARLEETASALRELERGIRLNHVKEKHGLKPTVVAIGGIRLGAGRKRGQGGGVGETNRNIKPDPEKDDVDGDAVPDLREEGEGRGRRLMRENEHNLDPIAAENAGQRDSYAEESDESEDETGRANVNRNKAKKKKKRKGNVNVAGMLSYPNFSGPCRPLQYPDLALLYDACSLAGVQCMHVFLHRDPHASVYSVVRRGFGRGGASTQMKVAGTMLDVVRAQLEDFPDKLAACWDYDVGTDDLDAASRGGGVLALGELLGWDRATFVDLYKDIYKQSEPLSEEEKDELTNGGELEPYMRGVVRSMGRAVETCRAIYVSNHPGR